MTFNIRTLILPLSMAAAMAAAPSVSAADYVQAGGALTFASEYQGDTFVGSFPGFRTTMSFDPARPQDARLDVTIPLAGASTDNADRDSTLQGSAFFNVARFAQARYTAEGFSHLGGDNYSADGVLELRGVKKPVTLEFTLTSGDRPALAGRARISRLAFDVGGGTWADLSIIPDEVAVSTRVRFAPAP
ncbi:YceI family protein [Luteimonas sp. A277]